MDRSESEWKFAGFSSPNFTTVPDEFFDDLVPRLGNAEMRVLLYIIRRTFGFKKQTDAISLSQMVDGIVRKDGTRLDAGTGLKKAAVCRALASLEKSGIILRQKQFARSGGAIATSYQLRMQPMVNNSERQTPVYEERQGTNPPCLRGETGTVHQKKQALSTRRDTQYTVNNKQSNNNVNVSNKRKKDDVNYLHLLPDAHSDAAHITLIADDILEILGDKKSTTFYTLVARKVPEQRIRRTLSELKEGKVRSKAKVFTHQMMQYAQHTVDDECNPREKIEEDRKTLVKRLSWE